MTWRPGDSRAPPPKEVRTTSDIEPTYLPSRWELRDFAASYVLLSATFGILFVGGGERLVIAVREAPTVASSLFLLSFLTAGIGFVVHELAHRMVAIRFGRAAAFRAHYGMLALGIVTALAGFVFAAPGGVYHRRDVPLRERGLIALAGPASNVGLAVAFGILVAGSVVVDPAGVLAFGDLRIPFDGLMFAVGGVGVVVNCMLAGFNMLPFGPLDGGKVYLWSTRVYVAVAVPCILVGAAAYVLVFVVL